MARSRLFETAPLTDPFDSMLRRFVAPMPSDRTLEARNRCGLEPHLEASLVKHWPS